MWTKEELIELGFTIEYVSEEESGSDSFEYASIDIGGVSLLSSGINEDNSIDSIFLFNTDNIKLSKEFVKAFSKEAKRIDSLS